MLAHTRTDSDVFADYICLTINYFDSSSRRVNSRVCSRTGWIKRAGRRRV